MNYFYDMKKNENYIFNKDNSAKMQCNICLPL